jgi:pimeloyl-ACP methyl ester carboxylesterase
MKALLGVLLGFALAVMPVPSPAVPAGDKPNEKVAASQAEGYWLGRLKFIGLDLRLGIHITPRKGGALSGTLDSPDEGIFKLPLNEVAFKDGAVRFEIKRLQATFEGKLKEDGAELVGVWKQSGLKLPITFKREPKVPVFTRPQDPKKPYPYREEEVTYENRKAGVKFVGTLTLPRGEGPFPAVLLITGSGPQNRDEELFGHRPFLVLADHLTRRGIAVLRVDDRGVGGSTGKTMESTSVDFAEDALAGVEFLKGCKEINPKQIGLAGHSEGGLVAPLAASRSKDVAFVVMLAGTGLPGEDIMYIQSRLIWKAAGSSEAFLKLLRRSQELLARAVKDEKGGAAAEKRFERLWGEEVAKLKFEELGTKVRVEKEGLVAWLALVRTRWGRAFLTHDPRPALRKVSGPVLALFGEKDLQVPPRENLPEVAKALAEGVCKDYTVTQVPGTNHLFQTCKTGSPSEYGRIQETMSPVVLATISEWILKRTQRETNHRGTESTEKRNTENKPE